MFVAHAINLAIKNSWKPPTYSTNFLKPIGLSVCSLFGSFTFWKTTVLVLRTAKLFTNLRVMQLFCHGIYIVPEWWRLRRLVVCWSIFVTNLKPLFNVECYWSFANLRRLLVVHSYDGDFQYGSITQTTSWNSILPVLDAVSHRDCGCLLYKAFRPFGTHPRNTGLAIKDKLDLPNVLLDWTKDSGLKFKNYSSLH